MSYAELWTKTTASKDIASFYLNKFGHLLKWKDYKETILEVGCAEGSVTKELLFPFVKSQVKKLVAIDKLDEMINCARKGNTIKEIDFQVMDAMDKEAVDKRSNQFDHIFSTMMAHWIPDNRTYLTHLYRMLKPGGQIFQTQLTNEQVLRKSFQKQFEEGTWSKYAPNDPVFPDYTDEPIKYVRNLFQEIGFEVEFCEMKNDVSIVENFGDFLKPLFHIYKHLDSIPKDLHEEFFQYHIQNSRDFCIYRGEPDKYEYHYQTLICIASKSK